MQITLNDEDMYPDNKRNVRRSACRYLAAMVILTAFSTNAAVASGYMTTPEYRLKMPSFKACLDDLEASASEHRKQLKPRTFEPDGGFREVGIEALSGGVKITGPKGARYEAKIWYHNGSLVQDGTQYEINHSWTHSSFECRGKTAIINGAQGYTLSTFEPVQSKAP